GEDWKEGLRVRGAWEGGHQSFDAAVPVLPSPFIIPLLFRIAEDVNRISGCFFELPALNATLRDLGGRVLNVYQAFVKKAEAVSAIGATQLLFDVLFWGKIFEGVWGGVEGGDENGEVKGRVNVDEITTVLKAKIDSSQSTTLEEIIKTNVERSYSRSHVLLGSLLLLNHRPSDIRKSLSTQEMHNVIPLATQPPRFTLLPVTSVPTNKPDRRVNSSSQATLTASRRRSSAVHALSSTSTTTQPPKTLRKPRSSSIHLLRSPHVASPSTPTTPSLTNVMGLVSSVSGLARDIQLGQVQQKTSEVFMNASNFISGVWGAGAGVGGGGPSSPSPGRRYGGE
ncbi:hypothetical protein HK097_002444, partial [Rhizophlyctis rosea]